MNIPSIEYIKSHKSHREFFIKKDFPGYLEYLNKKFPHIHNFTQKLWLDLYGFNDYPQCPICGQPVKTFQNFTKGFVTYCCPTCAQNDPKVREKNHKTNVERYGEDYMQIVADKGNKTKLIKYGKRGYNNPEKFKQTMISKYGVENPMQIESSKQKSEETCIQKYGAKRKILSTDYQKKKREILDQHLVNTYPEVIDVKDNGQTFICSCTDPNCTLCESKIFEISYYQYYLRKYRYNIEICTTKRKSYPSKNTDIEVFIQNILDEYDIKYETNNRKILGGKELDIYIPDHKLAIECNGIYWHSDKMPRMEDRKFHYNKWINCKSQGIQLLTIWEDQIINKPEIIKNIVLSKLGIYKHSIGARECTIKETSNSDAHEFLSMYHLQGPISGSVRLGLYHNDELVSLMVFGRKRTALGNKKHDTWELYRYCTKADWTIMGGAQKLLSHFRKEHPDTILESFSSNDISDGRLYEKLGFTLESIQSCSYWYIDKEMNRHHRYTFRKDVLVRNGADPNLTEFEITDGMGLFRIYDSGQQKWIL